MTKAQNIGEMKIAATGGAGSNGVTSFWNDIERAEFPRVRAAWIAAGLDEKLLPEPPDPEPALRAALKVCGQAKAKVVKRPGKGQGFVLVDLKRFDERNLPMANNRIIARVVGEEIFLTDERGLPSTDTDCERIRGEYAAIRREISKAQVSAWLTGLIEDCEGIRLRDGGGLYWVRKSRVAKWNGYRAAIEGGTGARISAWPTYGSDGEVIRDVLASFEDRARTKAEKIQAELAKVVSGEEPLGPEALENRRATIGAFLDELAAFSEEVGRPSAISVQVVARVQANLTSVIRYADGVAAGRDMTAPRLLDLEDMPAKPKTALEIAEELAADRAVTRMGFIGEEVAKEIAAAPVVENMPDALDEREAERQDERDKAVKPPARPFRPRPAIVENDAQANRFGLIELD